MKVSFRPPSSSTLLVAWALVVLSLTTTTTTEAFVPPMPRTPTAASAATASNGFDRPSLFTSTTTSSPSSPFSTTTRSSSTTTTTNITPTTLFYSIQRRNNNIDDLESARAAFEKLMQEQSGNGMLADLGILAPPEEWKSVMMSSPTSGPHVVPHPYLSHHHNNHQQQHNHHHQYSHLVLTSAGKHRRMLEMELLSSLEESDDAIEELIHLWTTERDGEAATDLLAMQEECSEGLVLEELRLRELSQEYPGWAEPFARLATLLYYKGRTREAYHMAEQALELKPWHFEATQLLILLSLREENHAMALKWARMSLPKLRRTGGGSMACSPKNLQRRKAWVQRALEMAAEQLQQAEHVTEQMQRRAALEFLQEQPEYIWQ